MNWSRLTLILSGAILLTAALVRLLLVVANAPVLSLADPALGFPLRYTVLGVGALELLVAFICLFGKNPLHQLAWLAWLSTDYLAFRICLLFIRVHPQNTCIGALTDLLHLSRGTTGLSLSLIPILFLCSYPAMLYLWRQSATSNRLSATADRPLAAPEFGAGGPSSAICPPSSVPSRQFLRASCPTCAGHIEFPAHGLGQTIPCPHCHAPLTLKAPV